MGAKQSAEMLKAQALMKQGKTAYEAAALSGITKSAIYQSKWYKEFRNANPKNPK